MELDAFGHDYLRIGLEIGKHVEDYVDAYYGPPDIKAAVEAGPDLEPAELQQQVADLAERIPQDDPLRARHLAATLRAFDCTVRMAAGESFEYMDEVNRLYDIRPQPEDEATFEAAHRELDTLLPGEGSLRERAEARNKRYELPLDKTLLALEMGLEETRRRTIQKFDLLDGESVEMALVTDKVYSGQCNYLGDSRSFIEFNTDIPVPALRVPELMAHEVYPGHHTEAHFKDERYYRGKGYAEHAIMLLATPAGLTAEAIATTAQDIIFPDGSNWAWLVDELLPAVGIETGETAQQMARIDAAQQAMSRTPSNVALLYHSGQLDEAQAVDYIQTYGLGTPERARQLLSFIQHPVGRSYIYNYVEGKRLLEQAANHNHGGDKWPVFEHLVFNSVLPSEIATL